MRGAERRGNPETIVDRHGPMAIGPRDDEGLDIFMIYNLNEVPESQLETQALEILKPVLGVLLSQSKLLELHERIHKVLGMDAVVAAGKQPEADRSEPQTVEVEDKFTLDNVGEFQEKVSSLGFDLRTEADIDEEYFDVGHKLRDQKQVLRLRKEVSARTSEQSGEVETKFKGELKWEGPRGEIQDRPVLEIFIPSEVLLERVGELLIKYLQVESIARFIKHRWHYFKKDEASDLGSFEVELDEFRDPANPAQLSGKSWAQVALPVQAQDRARGVELVKGMAERLRLTKRDRRDYIEIAGVG